MKKIRTLIFLLVLAKSSFAQNPGDSLFSTLIHNVYITFPVSTWYDTLTNNYTQSNLLDSSIYYSCNVVVDGITLNNVGARFKGNSSYGHPNQKKSIKLDFEEYVPGQKLDFLKQINLNNSYNDPTFLREKLQLDFCIANGLDAPRCVYANVYINGALWAFYTIIEEVDKTFLNTHYGNKQGNLFKGDPSGHLKWLGTVESNYYPNYELKTNEDINNWSDLVKLIDKINNSSFTDWTDSVTAYFNLNKYLKHYASTMLFGTLDSYTGSGHNYYLYHNSASNQMEFIQWDVNGAFGRHHPSGQGLTNEALLDAFWVPTPAGSRPLHEKILAQPLLKQDYVTNLCGYLNSYFDTTSMYARIDAMANNIRTYVYNDPRKQFTNTDFENNQLIDFGINTPGLKKFVKERNYYLDSTLSSYGCAFVSINSTANKPNKVIIYPNPFSSSAVIELSAQLNNAALNIFNLYGQKVKTINSIFGYQIKIERGSLNSGLYLYELREGSKNMYSGKILITD